MGKRLFLLLFISMFGVISTPGFLSADKNIEINQPDFHAVETKPVEVKKSPEPVITPQIAQKASTPRVTQSAPVYTPTANSITIAGRTIATVNTGAITESGAYVNHYTGSGGKFYYGHNSSEVFGNLKNVSTGTVFQITVNGITTNYKVMKREIYQKNVQAGTIELNDGQNHMNEVAAACYKKKGAAICSESYDVSIMTCHGVSLGAGDATERLVLFASKY